LASEARVEIRGGRIDGIALAADAQLVLGRMNTAEGFGAESGQVKVYAAWRAAVTRHAAVAYAGNAKFAALSVAISVGFGLLLAQARTDADIGSSCQELSQRRRAIDPSSAGRMLPWFIISNGGLLGSYVSPCWYA
jgi:hypothetical protein